VKNNRIAKQLAQTAVAGMAGVDQVVNGIEVVW
jgi:hypothetical protein